MNHLDLFSGIGGFSLGLKLAGVEPKWIGYSDIDKYANQVFKRRFPNAKELGSIIDIRPDELPKIDLVTFGFPCQDLSIAGKRGGLKANRSSLFFKAIEIIRHKKPKYFVFENVKGLFSSNGGQDFLLILRAISDIGYDGQWQLLNTRWFLPQNRERVYFVGHIRGESRPKVFPIGEDGKEVKKLQGQYTNTLKARYQAIGDGSYIIEGKLNAQEKVEIADFRNDEGLRIRKDGVSPCLATRKHSEKDISTMPPIVKVHTTQPRSGNPDKGGTGPLSRDDGNAYCLDTGNSQAVEYNYSQKSLNETLEKSKLKENDVKALDLYNRKAQDISPTLTEPHHNTLRLYDKAKIRRLTPTETCRLQGFPDDWNDCCSDTQRYKQTGNAVSVPVVQAIMERLYER